MNMIKFVVGFLILFGVAGAIESSPVIGVVPLFWLALGIVMLYQGITSMEKN